MDDCKHDHYDRIPEGCPKCTTEEIDGLRAENKRLLDWDKKRVEEFYISSQYLTNRIITVAGERDTLKTALLEATDALEAAAKSAKDTHDLELIVKLRKLLKEMEQ